MAWKKRYDDLDLQNTSDRKKSSLRQKNRKFCNSNSPSSCCCSLWAFLGSSCGSSFCKFIWKRSAESFSSSTSRRRNRKSRLEVFYENIFLAISQSLQGNFCAKISFLRKLKTSSKFFKKEIPAQVFFNFAKLLRTPTLQKSCEQLLLEKVIYSTIPKQAMVALK